MIPNKGLQTLERMMISNEEHKSFPMCSFDFKTHLFTYTRHVLVIGCIPVFTKCKVAPTTDAFWLRHATSAARDRRCKIHLIQKAA